MLGHAAQRFVHHFRQALHTALTQLLAQAEGQLRAALTVARLLAAKAQVTDIQQL